MKLVTLAAAACIAGCAVNPVTGEQELALISEPQEIAMGREAAGQVATELGLIAAPDLESYVASIGLELARDSERPELPWEFHVVDDAVPNAFALPGGFIFVTRGLLDLLSSEAELATVLGHEIGHVTARHSVSQLSRAQLAQLGLGIGVAVVPELANVGALANTGLGLLFLKYGRDDERQADALGFDYALHAGYDIREMDDVFEALQASAQLAGASPLPSWLASHPSGPERVAAARERIASLGEVPQPLERGVDSYLARIDGLTYGDDPRNGYFDGGVFYHPDLAFRFDVPADWERQNLNAAVLAVSPGRDAGLVLTLAPGNASEAATSFLSQEAILETATERTEINGFDAIVSRFRAETQDGVARGVVAHIDGPGRTYRLVAHTHEAVFESYSDLFESVLASFDAVTDPKVLNVEPRRIAIVELDRDMTLGEIAARHRSSASLEELAVLNHIADSSAVLTRGTKVKTVVH